MTKSEDSLRGLWDTIQKTHIHMIGITKKTHREKRDRKFIQAIMTENIPSLRKKTDIQVQEDKRVTNETNPERDTL